MPDERLCRSDLELGRWRVVAEHHAAAAAYMKLGVIGVHCLISAGSIDLYECQGTAQERKIQYRPTARPHGGGLPVRSAPLPGLFQESPNEAIEVVLKPVGSFERLYYEGPHVRRKRQRVLAANSELPLPKMHQRCAERPTALAFCPNTGPPGIAAGVGTQSAASSSEHNSEEK
jgi:hypothetical protein